MAENKKSFVLYSDLLENIEHLTNEEKGIIFNHLLLYVNDKNPILEDRLIITAWKPIERQLKRDLIKFEQVKKNKSNSGAIGNLKRWHCDLYENVINKKMLIEDALEIAKNRTATKEVADNRTATKEVANIAVNDNVNDNVNDILLKKETKSKNEIFSKEILESQSWIETICMQNKIIPDKVNYYIDVFNKKLLTELDLKISKKDYASHFSRWLPTEILKINKNPPQLVNPVRKQDRF